MDGNVNMLENALGPSLLLALAKSDVQNTGRLVDVRAAARDTLRARRNIDLASMLMHVASWVHYMESEEIMRDSTPLDYIWKYLQEHYNISAKGSDFLKITLVGHKPNMLASTYYKEYRRAFIDKLGKKGSSMGVKMDRALLREDEVL